MASQKPAQIPGAQLLFARLMRATPALWTGLGNLETRVLGRELDSVRIRRPIYVTGLARSGTTVVTELLSRHSDVTTHHYSDFPLVWTPYWWNSLRAQLPLPKVAPAERAHRDRLRVTPDSPEAVEEVIWMRFFAQAHFGNVNQVLGVDTENAGFEGFYRDHIRKLLKVHTATRYLAKGNYNITRLAYLLKLFPDARFVIMVRNPVWQVASLMKQDRLFCEQHDDDPRATDYLRLLGHYEFGVHKQPINISNSALAHKIRELWDTDQAVRGWALYWRAIYDFIFKQLTANQELADACMVLKYEDLCAEPAIWTRRIIEHCRLEVASFEPKLNAFADTISSPEYYRPDFTEEERTIIVELTRNAAIEFGYDPSIYN